MSNLPDRFSGTLSTPSKAQDKWGGLVGVDTTTFRSLGMYGVQPSSTLNQTTDIQRAIDADPGPMFIPSGSYLLDQLKISRRNGLVGAGMGGNRVTKFGGSQLIQADGVNVNFIITDDVECPPGSEWFHWCEIRNLILSKSKTGSRCVDTIGNAITIAPTVGEGMRCEDLYIEHFPGHGIAVLRGTTPLHWTNIHPFENGLAGIYFHNGGGANVYDIATLRHISGDGNGWNDPLTDDTCLIRVDGAGAARDVFKFDSIKAETRGSQKNAIHLHATGSAHFDIGPLTYLKLSSDAVDACIRITGTVNVNSFARIFYHHIRGSGAGLVLLRDVPNAMEIALATGRQIGTYTGNATNPPFDPSFLTSIPANDIPSKRVAINVTVGTLAVGDITGAANVNLVSTNATPGTQTTRTAAEMFADHFGAVIAATYTLHISNTGAGTFTLGAGSGVTLTGTMTVAQDTSRTFQVTFVSATAVTIISLRSGGV